MSREPSDDASSPMSDPQAYVLPLSQPATIHVGAERIGDALAAKEGEDS